IGIELQVAVVKQGESAAPELVPKQTRESVMEAVKEITHLKRHTGWVRRNNRGPRTPGPVKLLALDVVAAPRVLEEEVRGGIEIQIVRRTHDAERQRHRIEQRSDVLLQRSGRSEIQCNSLVGGAARVGRLGLQGPGHWHKTGLAGEVRIGLVVW